ncbi:hypothetical protein TNCV_1556221 [Trichonephila clavipes]|nr:hypothetical protein TNCV_1556221 [Trichonephila clavipes]
MTTSQKPETPPFVNGMLRDVKEDSIRFMRGERETRVRDWIVNKLCLEDEYLGKYLRFERSYCSSYAFGRSWWGGLLLANLQITPNHILECPSVTTKLLKRGMVSLRDSLREILYSPDAPRIAEVVFKTFDEI